MGINLTAVYLADMLGALMTVILLISNSWRLRDRSRENAYLMILTVLALLSCIADCVSFAFDGKPGALSRALVYVSNAWLYIMNVLCGLIWLRFSVLHLGIRLPRTYVRILTAVSAVFLILLLLNPVLRLAFTVDGNNVYERGPLFAAYLGLDMFFILNCLAVYILARRRGGMLKFFPVWLFIIPVTGGLAIQSAVYGTSVIWPCMAISVTGVFLGLQNELVFRDKLTGLYNRFYLDYLQNMAARSGKTALTVLMLDLNRFKEINDKLGHAAGDEALIRTGDILNGIVGDIGTVLRYAGDEFVILLNTQDDGTVDGVIGAIRGELAAYSASPDAKFELSASIGCCRINLADHGIDELMNEADRRMYEDKRRETAER